MQGQSTGVGYGLKYQARCIVDVKADPVNTSFLAGTLSLKEENEVHLIRLSQDGTELVCEGLFSHPNEIWDLASCPFNPRLFSTVFASGETYGASLWEIPEAHGQTNAPQLEEIVSFDGHSSKIKCVRWWPSGVHEKLISIDEENIVLWSLDASAKSAKVLAREPTGMLHKLSGGMWDPHDQNMVAGICDSSIQFWDLRSMKKASSIEHAHVCFADFNPQKQFILATAEEEAGIHIWDLRMPKTYLKELPGHTHWTWVVQHNPMHDNLILSAGTDSAVNLWMASVNENDDSSAENLDSPTHHADPLLNSYSDYEDSVYGIAWSHREPWIFASLSYDGRCGWPLHFMVNEDHEGQGCVTCVLTLEMEPDFYGLIVVESVKPYLPKI